MFRRVLHLLIGQSLYGAGIALVVEAGLGVDPWTVLAQGISLHTGVGVGWVTNLVGLAVMLAWIPLRQRPGVGTVTNILIVGTAMQLVLTVLPTVTGLLPRLALLAGGIVTVAAASGLYLGARFGAGPRDGLMTGLRSRLGWPIWLARASVELTVLAIGWLLGGDVGVGTVVFAVTIGPLVHVMMPLLAIRERHGTAGSARAVSAGGTAASPSRA